jgi:16S rRNA (uracil1498-N3)-methyltransferase
VLRLTEKDRVEVFDGSGASAICEIKESDRKSVSLKRVSDIQISKPSAKKVIFVIPLIKKDNFHFMVQKLCEIGISELIFYKPDLIDQSIAKKDNSKIYSKIEEVIIAACKQCGSNFIPTTKMATNLRDAVTLINKMDVCVFDVGAKSLFNAADLTLQDVCMITGPESGFSESEINLLNEKEFEFKLIGKNILRAETAPIVIASLIQNQFDKI